MEHNRKQKLLVIVALIVGIASLSIGFAAFSVSLNISSSASVTPSSDTFSIKFSLYSDETKTGTITAFNTSSTAMAKKGVVNNSPTPVVSDLVAIFEYPGQYVEYKLYIRNEGAYTAYLNNINYIGKKVCTAEGETSDSLVQSACDDINVTVKINGTLYNDTSKMARCALVPGSYEEMIIRLEYDANGIYVDGPFSISFPSISLVYSTIDDSTMKPNIIRLESGDLNTPGSIVSIGNEKFYVFGQEDGNVKLLSMYNLHVGNSVEWNLVDDPIIVPLLTPTGIQDSIAIGSKNDDQGTPSGFPWYGTSAFSSTEQRGTNYSDYSGSIVEEYVNNYASYLEGIGANITKVRLISKDELETLGCSEDSCISAVNWVYSTSYWTNTAYNSYRIWRVHSSGSLSYQDYTYDYVYGVRPVVEIPLSEF